MYTRSSVTLSTIRKKDSSSVLWFLGGGRSLRFIYSINKTNVLNLSKFTAKRLNQLSTEISFCRRNVSIGVLFVNMTSLLIARQVKLSRATVKIRYHKIAEINFFKFTLFLILTLEMNHSAEVLISHFFTTKSHKRFSVFRVQFFSLEIFANLVTVSCFTELFQISSESEIAIRFH